MLTRALSATLVALHLAGCATTVDHPIPVDHPANPTAAAAAVSPPSQTLEIGVDDVTADKTPDSRPAAAHHGPPAAGSKALYVCPMHKDVVSDQPGECPICKMKLKP